jgi:hypothetical protein
MKHLEKWSVQFLSKEDICSMTRDGLLSNKVYFETPQGIQPSRKNEVNRRFLGPQIRWETVTFVQVYIKINDFSRMLAHVGASYI